MTTIPATVVAAVVVGLLLGVAVLLPFGSLLVRRIFASLGRMATAGARRFEVGQRWPRLSAAVQRRFDAHRPGGLAVTLIVLAALYALVLAGGLIEDLYEAEGLETADEAVFALLRPFRSAELIAFFSIVTKFGATETLVAAIGVASGFMLAHGPVRYIVPMWIVIVGSQVTTWTGKFLLARPRPEFIFDVTAASPSFPSGHAASSTAIYGMIAYVIARDLRHRARLQLGYWTIVLIGLIGLSRMFLNVHYPSDVAAGHLVGVFWLLSGIAIAETGRPDESPQRE